MAEKKGTLSINSDNIFPIIKKWLYSDHDIFFRELISNGCDAITKLKKLDMMGEYNFPEGHKNKVEVILDPEKKTLKFIDTGLGMTADEVEKYITQIAFSGATQFLEQYKDKTEGDQIIGHFGLGFYSAFMVADEVTIDTLSYKEGAEPVHWTCDGGTEYTMATGTKETVGTEITLFLNEESTEFANEYRAREIIEKYCSFMPTEIFLSVEGAEQEFETIPEDQVKDDDVVVEHIHEDAKTEEKENLKEVLSKASYGYCMYCYSRLAVDNKWYGNLEHAIEKINSDKLIECIPNIGMACSTCNQSFKKIGDKKRKISQSMREQFEKESKCTLEKRKQCTVPCKALRSLQKSYSQMENAEIVLQPMGIVGEESEEPFVLQYDVLKMEFLPNIALHNYSEKEILFINRHIQRFHLNSHCSN